MKKERTKIPIPNSRNKLHLVGYRYKSFFIAKYGDEWRMFHSQSGYRICREKTRKACIEKAERLLAVVPAHHWNWEDPDRAPILDEEWELLTFIASPSVYRDKYGKDNPDE